ncbi:AraC family transcriptional regulator [Paenibacillus thalictri]|uniref:AraC family transcriptional regulator n=1 Tax=Paenibacillus thalictri TaxID=2527873 RepID=A0A4Q9DHQ0_9BACL|nr:AraC family transcriptional regulator [Paenibacillus thalictri]TBL71466.1 AraC family transcriptional regulator [Paenibacillus thalictri]
MSRSAAKTFPFQMMMEQPKALDRLDIQFRWGGYGIRVHKLHFAAFGSGKVIDFHKHSDYEFHYIPRGRGRVNLGDDMFALQEGNLYLTGPNVLHRQEADQQEPMEELCLHIDITRLDETSVAPPEAGQVWGEQWEYAEAEACISLLDKLPLQPVEDNYHAMECFLTAYKAWKENQLGLYTVIKQSVIQILLRTISAYAHVPRLHPPSRDMKHYRYQLAVQFIQDNFMAQLTIEKVAERVQISPRQLQRVFREMTGATFSDYVEKVRLANICGELKSSLRTIEQIAFDNGFSSSNYLHYVFKKKLGTTPTQYRDQYGGKELL